MKKCLSVCWSGLRDLKDYPLLGGGVPIPGQRLSRALCSVPIFSLLCFLSTMVPVPPYPPFKIHPGSLPSSAFCPYPLSSFLLPPLRPFLCRRPFTSSGVCHPSAVYRKSSALRLTADQTPFSWCPVQRP